jgi:UDP-N-acetylglucosamine 2-epimerase (non-hydrolysing)
MAVITDSGEIQEEITFLGVPCLTLRQNTERPETISLGTNILIGRDMERLKEEVKQILDGNRKQGQVLPLWDGHAAQRLADAVVSWGDNRDMSLPVAGSKISRKPQAYQA